MLLTRAVYTRENKPRITQDAKGTIYTSDGLVRSQTGPTMTWFVLVPRVICNNFAIETIGVGLENRFILHCLYRFKHFCQD